MIKNTIVIIMVVVIIIKLNETHMLNNVDKDTHGTSGDSCSSNQYFLIASGISLHTFCAIVGCFSLLLIRVLP